MRDKYQVLHRLNFENPYFDMPMRLSVRENLTVYALLYGVRLVDERIAQLAGELDLADLLERRVSVVGRAEDQSSGLPRR